MQRQKWIPVTGFPSYELSDLGNVRLATGSHLPVHAYGGKVWLYRSKRAKIIDLGELIERHKGKFL